MVFIRSVAAAARRPAMARRPNSAAALVPSAEPRTAGTCSRVSSHAILPGIDHLHDRVRCDRITGVVGQPVRRGGIRAHAAEPKPRRARSGHPLTWTRMILFPGRSRIWPAPTCAATMPGLVKALRHPRPSPLLRCPGRSRHCLPGSDLVGRRAPASSTDRSASPDRA